MSELVRAFLSIDIENKALLPQISETQRKLDTSLAKMKFVEIENIHFTMKFFGDTSLIRIGEIRECLNKIKIEPFEIMVHGVGAFPTKRKPRVIWIGVTQNADRVRSIIMEVDSRLKELGYQPEKQKFTPHATIARVRYIKDAEQLANNLDDLVNQPIGPMTVSKLSMKKSTLTPSGPIYETLWTIS
ncbi:RNA 2',3'-cyclic phosphodiesterase [Candidatus Thorarchaeota archaeon]|nr:MAG: RNA 2',3'-cyclic phosphodiesterase [Candidatus Thorarchaeota archaeon]